MAEETRGKFGLRKSGLMMPRRETNWKTNEKKGRHIQRDTSLIEEWFINIKLVMSCNRAKKSKTETNEGEWGREISKK